MTEPAGWWRYSRLATLFLATTLVLVFSSCSSGTVDRTTTTGPLASTSTVISPTTTTPPVAATTVIASTTTTTEEPISTTTTTPLAPLRALRLELLTDGLHQPVVIASSFGEDRLYVAERTGIVQIVDPSGEIAATPLLDLTDEVNDFSIEQGLLGLAFHPDDTGPQRRMYVYFSVDGDDTMLVEYRTTNATSVDLSTRRVLLTIDQPAIRHNAGMIQFDEDRALYLSLGDGGSGGSNGQDTSNLLGGIIRIDVNGDPYAIPASNPFSDGGGAPELWIYGLRNPWRFSIDQGFAYVADVGQDDREEITVVSLEDGGANLGWSLLEGSLCFSERNCDPKGTVLPTLEYTHDDGCSVTGGFVYRGSAIPELFGHYFYSDWCSGWIRSFVFDGETATDQQDWTDQTGVPGQVNTFGVDNAGELYLATWSGSLYRFVAER